MSEGPSGRKRPRSGTIFGQRAQKVRRLSTTEKKEVKKIIGSRIEVKYFDQTSQYGQIDRASICNPLSHIVQGVGNTQRVGAQVTYKSLDLRITAYYNGGIVGSANHVLRIFVFKWLDDDGVNVPTQASVLQYAGAIGDYRNIVSPVNWESWRQKDIVVLYDRAFSIGEGSSLLAFHKKIKVRGTANFTAAALTGTGNIYMLLCADDATGAHTPDLQVQWWSRITFTDA